MIAEYSPLASLRVVERWTVRKSLAAQNRTSSGVAP